MCVHACSSYNVKFIKVTENPFTLWLEIIDPVFVPALIIEPAEPEVEEGDGEKKEGEEGEHEGSISRAEDVASVNKEEELALPEVIIIIIIFL